MAADPSGSPPRPRPLPRPPSLLALPSYLASYVAQFGRRLLEVALAERGLLLVHNAVLVALDDFGPMSQQELADSLRIDKSHLVGHIDRLEERDLVRRTRDPGDRRRHRIELTAAGQELVEELKPIAVESQARFLDVLTPAERRSLVSMLERVLAANDEPDAGRP